MSATWIPPSSFVKYEGQTSLSPMFLLWNVWFHFVLSSMDILSYAYNEIDGINIYKLN